MQKWPKEIMIAWELAILALSVVVFGAPNAILKDDQPAVTQEMVDFINSQGKWKASLDWVGSKTVGEVKRLVGSKSGKIFYPEAKKGALGQYVSIPSTFDSRVQWPGCIGAIRFQGQCSDCWAFSSTEVLADRYCIENGVEVVLSPQYLVDCRTDGQPGCVDNTIYNNWAFLEKYGVPPDSCDPYISTDGVPGMCSASCGDLYLAYDVYSYNGVADIQTAILAGGPVQTTMTIYMDFYAYRSGVYEYLTGEYDGGHAVKIIGWGVENGTNYWIVANSWGTGWGMNGFFWIAFGQCGIGETAVAGSVSYYSASQWLQVLGLAYLLLVS